MCVCIYYNVNDSKREKKKFTWSEVYTRPTTGLITEMELTPVLITPLVSAEVLKLIKTNDQNTNLN